MAIEDLGSTAAFFSSVAGTRDRRQEQEDQYAFSAALQDMSLRMQAEKQAQQTAFSSLLTKQKEAEDSLMKSKAEGTEIVKMMGIAEDDPNISSDFKQILQNSRDNIVEQANLGVKRFDSISNMMQDLVGQINETKNKETKYQGVVSSFNAGKKSGIGSSLADFARQMDKRGTTEKYTATREEINSALDKMQLSEVDRAKLQDPAMREGVIQDAMEQSNRLLPFALEERGVASDEKRTQAIRERTAQDKLLKPNEAMALYQMKFGNVQQKINEEAGVQTDPETGEVSFPENATEADRARYFKKKNAAQAIAMKEFEGTMKANYGNKYVSSLEDYDSLFDEVEEIKEAFGSGFKKEDFGSLLSKGTEKMFEPRAGNVTPLPLLKVAYELADLAVSKESIKSEINKGIAGSGKAKLTDYQLDRVMNDVIRDLKAQKKGIPSPDEILNALKEVFDDEAKTEELVNEYKTMKKQEKK